jgi:tetratricopeptide (TPR) repeat protein
MTPEQWQRVESLFEQALDVEPDERAHWLARNCPDDGELRDEVERLLTADAKAAGAVAGAVAESVRAYGASHGVSLSRAGPYRILSELGRGGMGVVYLARRDDEVFQKDVAVKVVKRGMDTDLILERFRHEREILARLEHPYIARILDGGNTMAGLPYLVMEYVKGVPITDYCSRHNLDLGERLELFRRVCAAVQYAHQNLVVHRDLKPTNILVDDSGSPKLLDFGIAKLLMGDEGQPTWTQDHPALTPRHASPEQVTGDPITTASDTYSLGTILYELLTGVAAHRITGYTPMALAQAICADEVVLPSVAARDGGLKIAGDLDNILVKALQKDRRRRYESVEQFSEDLQRYLDHLPVLARPRTVRYRALKFMRRNRVAVILGAAVTGSLIAGIAISTQQARRADRRFQQVRKLAEAFVFDVHDQIQNLPGATQARESVVRIALEYLDSLARESAADPHLQWELASAYQRIGDVQGYGVRPNLGHKEAAMESHRKALNIARRLAADSRDPRVLRLLARAHHRVGYLLRVSDAAEGMTHFRQGLEVAETLYTAETGNPETIGLLLDLHGHLGETALEMGDVAAALKSWARTFEVAQRWVDQDPTDEAKNALIRGRLRMSRALQVEGDLNGALQHARESVTIAEALSRANPVNAAYRRNLLNSYEQVAGVWSGPYLPSFRNGAEALIHYAKVNAIAEELADADPSNVMARSDLSLAHHGTCFAMLDDDPLGAVAECRRALAVLPEAGDNHRVRVNLALASAFERSGRWRESLDLVRSAIAVLTREVERNRSLTRLRQDLLRGENQLGALLLETGDAAGATAHHRQALAAVEELLRLHPADPLLHRDLADCYESLGRLSARTGDRTGAREWFRKSVEIWSQWARWGVSGAYNARRKDAAAMALTRLQE